MECETIFKPLVVAGHTFKSRILHSVCYVTEMEHGPNPKNRLTPEQMFARATRYYRMVARSGAALASMSGGGFPVEENSNSPYLKFSYLDPVIRAGYRKLLDAVHAEQTFCTSDLSLEPRGYRFSNVADWEKLHFVGDYNDQGRDLPEVPLEKLEKMIRDYGYYARQLKDLGFDGVNLSMAMQPELLCSALSPVFNQRTDQYGGSTIRERARFPLAVLRSIRSSCGNDFIIQLTMSAAEEPPGYTCEDWLDFLELAEGLYDVIQVRGFDGSYTHVSSFNSSKENPANLRYAKAFKQRGLSGAVAPVGGFGDPHVIDRVLRNGEADAVFMARMFYAEPDYAQKLRSGHPEKIVPCLGCMQNCGFPSCAVNPKYGLILDPDLFPPTTAEPKKVAVIGGGPAGIRAALAAAELGHSVTLYEKSSELGGQLYFAKYPSFKWRILDYLNWLIEEISSSPVQVVLNTEAAPETLKGQGYDVVFLAMGSSPRLPPIPGAETCAAWNVNSIWGNESKLGKRVLVVGGSSSSREVALYLAQCGHKVTMVTRKQEMYSDNNHCIWGEYEQYLNEKNLTVIEFAATREILRDRAVVEVQRRTPEPLNFFNVGKRQIEEIGSVREKIPGYIYPSYPYAIENAHPPLGKEPEREYPKETRVIEYDSIVLSGGRDVPMAQMKAFAGAAERIIVIGDAMAPGTIHEATITAYAGVRSI